jgi:2-keto-4-pentenoate hydratase/2-oxohepta-3-ene-1,7-dioic acid hydratase in catechol pathway
VKLLTFLAPGGGVRAGLLRDGRVRELPGGMTVVDVLAGRPVPAGVEELGSLASETGNAESWALADVQLLAPVPAPGAIYGIGLNYAAHVAETGRELPEQPIVFVKVAGSVAPPGGPIRCPGTVRRLDYEGELTIVIGAGGAIGGYCVADDVSARDLQRREPQWTRAKGADTFCPFGPWVTTADEAGDVHDLQLRTWVNGDLRQDSRTSDLIFKCEQLVEFIAQTCTLRPGDLILTGTPSGVGMAMDPPTFLESGDVVRIEIERLGAIEHSVE